MLKEKLSRVVSGGWNNFKRNSYVSFGTTGVMTLVLLVFLMLITASYITTTIVTSLEEKVDVTVYFKTTATEEEIFAVKDEIAVQEPVAYVQYISRDEALEEFKARHAGDPLIQESLAELEGNPLQASLNIKAKDPNQYATIVNSLEGNKFRLLMDKINFYENEQVIDRIEKISGGLQNWGLIAILIMAVIAVLVTFNTIRLTIYNQKHEIEIMRLVGGSNWFIRAPYIIEGTLYGVFAASIALVLFYPVLSYVSPKVELLMPGVSLIGYFIGNAMFIVPLIVIAGILLGVISSSVAIRRFLKI
ncbi:MAG: permease-like cell division protein FtsX [Candidatus Yanofskybacteria bacterium]|nr:permease-like cell division protein FtsX [Candidatus Yanofskybacteria bacterium]